WSSDVCSSDLVADLLRLPVEDLVEQEVGHVPVAAGEALDELVDVPAAGQRQRGEVQAGRPALGPLDQALDLPAVELHGREAGEEVDGLVDIEAQVGLPQLDDLADEADAVELDRRVRPRRQDEGEVGPGEEVDEPGQQAGG